MTQRKHLALFFLLTLSASVFMFTGITVADTTNSTVNVTLTPEYGNGTAVPDGTEIQVRYNADFDNKVTGTVTDGSVTLTVEEGYEYYKIWGESPSSGTTSYISPNISTASQLDGYDVVYTDWYQVEFDVYNMSGANLNGTLYIDESDGSGREYVVQNGNVKINLYDGDYTATVTSEGYENATKNFTVNGSPKYYGVMMYPGDDGGESVVVEDNETDMTNNTTDEYSSPGNDSSLTGTATIGGYTLPLPVFWFVLFIVVLYVMVFLSKM